MLSGGLPSAFMPNFMFSKGREKHQHGRQFRIRSSPAKLTPNSISKMLPPIAVEVALQGGTEVQRDL